MKIYPNEKKNFFPFWKKYKENIKEEHRKDFDKAVSAVIHFKKNRSTYEHPYVPW